LLLYPIQIKMNKQISNIYTISVNSIDFNDFYYRKSGGCFGGEGNVLMYNNTYKNVKDIQKGDIVAYGATVLCVTSFEFVNTINYIDGNNVLKISPWHPVIKNGQWVFPINEIANNHENVTIHKTTVYNFILDSVHLITINNIVTCTLGHNIKGPIIGHEFYGTDSVVNDIKKMNGWKHGFINIDTEIQLNDKNGSIIGYFQKD